jgi:hypothetical protein
MSVACRLVRSVVATLLIVAAFAAGHEHRLLAAPSSEVAVSQAASVAPEAARFSGCAVCRALQSTEPAVAVVADRVVVRTAVLGDVADDRPITLPRKHRSPRGPPALHA